MKIKNALVASIAVVTLTGGVNAADVKTEVRTDRDTRVIKYDNSDYTNHAGDWDFTLGGSGNSDRHFRGGGAGVNVSLGYYLNDNWEVGARQSISYSNAGGNSWDGSTFAFLDYNFNLDRFQPFVGINTGGIYGDQVKNTWAGGLEAGLKFYVRPKTYIYGMAQYEFTFRRLTTVNNNLSNGQLYYSVGLGLIF